MLPRPSSRSALTPYPGSQHAPAFATAPDNAFGISGMTLLGEAINRFRR